MKKLNKKLIITGNYLIHKNNLSVITTLINNLSTLPLNYARFLTYNSSLAPKNSNLQELKDNDNSWLADQVFQHNKASKKTLYLISFNRTPSVTPNYLSISSDTNIILTKPKQNFIDLIKSIFYTLIN